jgi:protein TonB
MGVRADAALALILALGLHGVALAMMGDKTGTGATAAGDGGTELVTIAQVAGDVAALIAAWEAPPVVPDLPEPMAATTPEVPPVIPAPDAVPPEADIVPPSAPEAFTPPALMQPPAVAVAVAEAAPPPPQPEPPPEPIVKVNPDLHPKPRPKPKADPEPAPNPQPKREPKPAHVPAAQAAGQGGGGAVGQAGQAEAGTEDTAGAEEALAAWGADIRARIERKKTYPRGADGATGVVTLVITVTPQGGLGSVSVAASSGNAVLDAAAVKAVQSARLPKGPAGIDPAGHSFRFRLRYER